MACTLPYIESKFRQSNPEVADKLNNQHIKIVQDAVDSNLFRFKNRQLLFSQEGTKKLERQRDYVNNINQQYGVNVLKNVDGVLSVNVLGLAPSTNVSQVKKGIDFVFKPADVQYQLPQDRELEEYVASEKTIRDLAARLSDRIGVPIKFESDRSKPYKGKLENNVAYVNLAYATLDTPIHEILGHPIIRAIKNRGLGKYNSAIEQSFTLNNDVYEYSDFSLVYEKNGKEITKDEYLKAQESFRNNSLQLNNLYQNLLKELEYGKGKEVLDRIKRDYNKKFERGKSFTFEGKDYIADAASKTGYRDKYGDDVNSNELETALFAYELKHKDKVYYTLEEQQEEAIVELLGLMTAEKLDAVNDGKLISLLKRLLKEMKQFVRSLINQKEVEIDKLPDNMTLGDIADLLAYSNSKLILPGNEVVYTTPDNQQFKTYAEASKHISDLAKSVEDTDLSDIQLPIRKKVEKASDIPVNKFIDEFDNTTYNRKDGKWFIEDTNRTMLDDDIVTLWNSNLSDNYINKAGIEGFIEKNKEYEQSKEIIEEWKKVNNIQYNPEEVYSRGQEFVSVVGAYSDFDVNLMMQNLLQHIEDNQKAGGEFTISAFTKPVDKQISHLEGGGGKIKFKIYPQSKDIKWAANTDVFSGSVWDASEKVNKDKKSELLGVSYTKYPSLRNVDKVQPNLASIVDDLAHHHNELGISLTGSNFRLEYDKDIPYTTKKIIDSINSILDQKYGKLVKPEINLEKAKKLSHTASTLEGKYIAYLKGGEEHEFNNRQELDDFIKTLKQVGKQPTQTNETLKESIDSIKNNQLQRKTAYSAKEGNILRSEGWKSVGFNHELGEEYFEKPNTKEYTEQALVNTKIAKLKEVAKKYPRSLIRSEVRPLKTHKPLFKEEMPLQKLPTSSLYQAILNTGVSPEEATRLYNQTKTPEFKNWFGNSVVKDENGEPLLVYHGTKSKEDFDTFKAGSSTGMFFTDDKQYAADVRGGRVVGPFFLRIEKPVEVEEEIDNDVAFENKDKGDGIIGVDYGQGLSSDGKTFVVYNPNQIKSLNNTGQFSESPNIYLEQGEQAEGRELPNEKELENKLIEFLNSKGIAAEKIKAFQKRMGERGTPITIYGMADMLNKLVRFSDVTSLVEETAHMMVEMFVDTNSSILEQVVDTEQYKKVKEDYKDVYATESEFRKEALGKIVKKAMIDRNTEGIASRLLSRIKYFWNKMVDFFKGVKGLDTYLEEIMEMNPSKFDSSRLGEGVYYEIQLTPEQKILNDAIEAKKRRLEGMKRRMTEAKVEKNLEDQINSLKLDILKDQVELGIEKLIGFIKEDLKVVEKYVFNNKSFSGNVLGHLKDFIYYYKPLLEDIQRIDGHKDINELIGRFRKVESVYIDSRKGAVKNELGIDVGSEIDTDINRAEYYFGSLRDVGSDIARRVHALITEMKNLVFQKMYEPSIDLIREVGNVDVKRLREKVGGKYTHFFVTQYKLGEWYESERSFKDALRKEFGLEDGQYEPLEKKDRIKYYRKLHQWKSKNQERKMLPEYYEMFLNLSYDTQVARDKYSADIKNLLLEVTSANGEVRFEDLTEEQWETLNRLDRERRMLGNLYYEDGIKKEGTDLEIALEIKELNSKLKDHQTKDTSKYAALWHKKKKELSPEKFKLWEERTTETVYDDEFFELLDQVGRDDYSEEYIQLRDEKNELIKPYRKADLSAEPVDIPDSVRDRIKELDRRMDALRSRLPKREKLDVKFSDVADVVKIPEYSKEYSAAQKRGKDAFKEWYDANHYTDVRGVSHPISIWTQVLPKDKKFIKRVPKSYWMEVSKDSVFYNPNFDESWHGPQPTKQWHNPQYDTLTAAEKRGLDALLKMNMEAHDLYKSSARRYYQLPQTTMSLFDAATEGDRLRNIKQVLLRSITDNSDDTEQGEVDEKGRMMQHIRPDGSQAYFIPKPFVRLVDDPNLISSDLVSSVIAIRTQAEKHKESLKINASTELLLDTLKDSRHVGKSGKVTLGSETNLYKAIRGFLEEHVFGIKTPPIGHVNVLGHNVNISKVLGKIEKYVRDKNLVGNLFVAATAATSGIVFSKIEDMVGTYTSNKSKMFANKEYLLNSPAMMLETGKKLKTNRVGLIISRFIGEQDMFDDLDKNRMARLGTETPYAPFTMVGHNISGRVVIAMLHNTRWDGNKFVTSQNYRGKDFDSLPSMYSMFEGKDNKAVVKKEYQDILTLKEIAKMSGKIRFVTDRIDSRISDTDKAAAHRDALLKLATTHRGWLFRNTQDRFKSKGFNYITEEFEEGHYRTWWRFLTKTVMRPNRLRILKNLLAEWETLEPYEKRNVIRSLWELGAAVSVGILARALQNLADDDDEDYLLNMASYVMNRTLLEVSVYPSLLTPLTFPIGISEVGSLLSSPIAAVSVVNTLTDVVYLFDSEEIESGRFEGMTHREKFLIKMTPGLSGYYTTTDPTSANQFLKGKALRPLNFIYKDE